MFNRKIWATQVSTEQVCVRTYVTTIFSVIDELRIIHEVLLFWENAITRNAFSAKTLVRLQEIFWKNRSAHSRLTTVNHTEPTNKRFKNTFYFCCCYSYRDEDLMWHAVISQFYVTSIPRIGWRSSLVILRVRVKHTENWNYSTWRKYRNSDSNWWKWMLFYSPALVTKYRQLY